MNALREKIDKIKYQIDKQDERMEIYEEETKLQNQRYNDSLFQIESLKRSCDNVRNKIKETESKVREAEKRLINIQTRADTNYQLRQKENITNDKIESLESKISKEKSRHMEISGMYEGMRARKQQLDNQIEKTKLLTKKKKDTVFNLMDELNKKKTIQSTPIVSLEDKENRQSFKIAEKCMKSELHQMEGKNRKYRQYISDLETTIEETKDKIENAIANRQMVEQDLEKIVKELENI